METERKRLELLLEPVGQSQLLACWDQLSAAEQTQLATQIHSVDWPELVRLTRQKSHQQDWGALAARAVSPRAIRLGQVPSGWSVSEARQVGEEALRQGRIGLIVVAGGQGTRLGFDLPKGLYPIGPVSGRSLFAMHFDRIRAVSRRFGRPLDLYVMTSPATDEATRTYLNEHQWLGLGPDQVHIFCQGTMPAVDDAGRALLESPSSLALSPDGHGGMLAALHRAGLLDRMSERGIQQLFYFQIDNPLVEIGDPIFLGHHLLARSEITTQVVAKHEPQDKVGNVVDVDGQTMVIEYSDLPLEAAQRRHSDGQLVLWAGNTAVHLMDVGLLRRQQSSADGLPFHLARKKVPYYDPAAGTIVEPQQPNATKFERFIFDLLPAAQRTLVVEVDERQAFAPLKNAPGAPKDTPEFVQRMLIQRDLRMLRAAGVEVAEGARVEINPLFALDEVELARRASQLEPIRTDCYLTDTSPARRS